MTDSYSQRKYAGMTPQELRQIPKEPAPKRFHGKKGKPQKPDEEIVDLWKVRPKDGKRWWWWSEPKFSVHTGAPTRIGYSSVPTRIIRCFRANLVRSNSMDIYWLQNEATKEQISPEFSNYDCFYDWLIYEALSRGWAHVESAKRKYWDFQKKKHVVRQWTRLVCR